MIAVETALTGGLGLVLGRHLGCAGHPYRDARRHIHLDTHPAGWIAAAALSAFGIAARDQNSSPALQAFAAKRRRADSGAASSALPVGQPLACA